MHTLFGLYLGVNLILGVLGGITLSTLVMLRRAIIRR